MAKIIRKIINVVYIVIIIALVVYFAFRLSNKIEIYNVETGSMEDNIHAGDYILVYKQGNYKVGDVVTYQVGSYFVTHRVIEVNMDSVITKGDANNTVDGVVYTKNIVGKVIFNGGILNGIILYKYFIVVIFIMVYLFTCLINDKEKEKSEEEILEATLSEDEINIEKKAPEAVTN